MLPTIKAKNTSLKAITNDLCAKMAANKDIKAEGIALKDDLEKEVYNLGFTYELLKAEADLREKDYALQKENYERENKVMKRKVEKLKEVIGSIYHRRNPVETDFYAKLEEFMEAVSLSERVGVSGLRKRSRRVCFGVFR